MKSVLKKNRFKGFTLVEVMTSLVIMTILIAVASGVIIVTFDIFGRSAVRRAAQNNGNNVYNYIYDHLSYATALKIDQTVDINNKENMVSVMTELGYTDSDMYLHIKSIMIENIFEYASLSEWQSSVLDYAVYLAALLKKGIRRRHRNKRTCF